MEVCGVVVLFFPSILKIAVELRIGPRFALFVLKLVQVFFCFFLFLKISFSLKKRIFQQKKQKQKQNK